MNAGVQGLPVGSGDRCAEQIADLAIEHLAAAWSAANLQAISHHARVRIGRGVPGEDDGGIHAHQGAGRRNSRRAGRRGIDQHSAAGSGEGTNIASSVDGAHAAVQSLTADAGDGAGVTCGHAIEDIATAWRSADLDLVGHPTCAVAAGRPGEGHRRIIGHGGGRGRNSRHGRRRGVDANAIAC